MKMQDTHKKSKVFHYDNAIITVYFPDISDEENERRMERIKVAAAALLKDTMKRKQQAQNNN
jgi:hypothetical protein